MKARMIYLFLLRRNIRGRHGVCHTYTCGTMTIKLWFLTLMEQLQSKLLVKEIPE